MEKKVAETVQKEVKKEEAKELPLAMIYKRGMHGYAVALKTQKGVETFDFNSKDAMCAFLGARNF